MVIWYLRLDGGDFQQFIIALVRFNYVDFFSRLHALKKCTLPLEMKGETSGIKTAPS